jgi:hypothetical protein
MVLKVLKPAIKHKDGTITKAPSAKWSHDKSEVSSMKKIVAPALKEKKTGVIVEAPSKAWAHDQLEAKEHIKKKKVKEGFVTSEDKFVKRKEAARIAKQAGQIKDKKIKKLHTSDLRKANNIKKKEIK